MDDRELIEEGKKLKEQFDYEQVVYMAIQSWLDENKELILEKVKEGIKETQND